MPRAGDKKDCSLFADPKAGQHSWSEEIEGEAERVVLSL